MKKIFPIVLFLCLSCMGLTAQTKEYFKEKKHELRLSFGSVNEDNYYDNFYNWSGRYYGGYGASGFYGGYNFNRYSLWSSYYDAACYSGPTKTTGVFGLSYFYNLSKIRFSFGGTFAYAGYNSDIRNRITDAKEGFVKGHSFSFTPTVRYAWLSKKWFRLYSGVGLSLVVDKTNYKQHSAPGATVRTYGSEFYGAFQLTPIGFSVGKDWFAFGEVNLGGRTGTFTGGVGYRF